MMRIVIIVFGILLFITGENIAQTKDLKKDFGAKGDGVSDDSKAWSDAIAFFNNKTGGELYIPEGTYRIGAQTSGGTQRYKFPEYTQRLTNAKNIKIRGAVGRNGVPAAKFKYIDNLYFGFFEKNGAPAHSSSQQKRAELDALVRLEGSCENITIEDLELDGNLPKLNLGTYKKHNLQHIGIYVNAATNVVINNVYVHHFGLDGLYIRAPYNKKEYNIYISNTISEYNGRQGMSFTSGRGLKVVNSKFRYTGKGGLSLSPSANVDIENHAGRGRYLEDILFEGCELFDNAGGSGSINLAGDIKNFAMKKSIIGTTNMYAIQSNYSLSRDFMFIDCKITGIIEMQVSGKPKTGPGVTKFVNCTITDNKNTKKFGLTRSLINVYDQVEFENCEFYIWDKRSLIHSYNNGKTDNKQGTVVFKNSAFKNVSTRKSLTPDMEQLSKTPRRIKLIK